MVLESNVGNPIDGFKVNTYNDNSDPNKYWFSSADHKNPAVTTLKNGNFAIVWESDAHPEDASSSGISLQLFNPLGEKIGDERLVNSVTGIYQVQPSITSLTNGSFVVAWWGNNEANYSNGVYAQVYDLSGEKIGSEIFVNDAPRGDQYLPSVSSLQNGNFIIAWYGDDRNISLDKEIYAQVFNSDGEKQDGKLLISPLSGYDKSNPVIKTLDNGNVVATWVSFDQDGSYHGIYAQILGSSGDKVGNEFQVNTGTYQVQSDPSVAILSNGNFIVTWRTTAHGLDIPENGTYAQLFDINGQKVGQEIEINDKAFNIDVLGLSDGRFLISWFSRGIKDETGNYVNSGIYGQYYNSDGSISGEDFLISSTSQINFTSPSVAELENGTILVSWEGDSSGNEGIYAKILGFEEADFAPNDITINNNNVDENASGAVIGELLVNDPNPNDTHTFTIDDDRFEVVNGYLKLKDGVSLDYESLNKGVIFLPNEAFSQPILVNVTALDESGLSFSKKLSVFVNNINEAPTNIFMASANNNYSIYTYRDNISVGWGDLDSPVVAFLNMVDDANIYFSISRNTSIEPNPNYNGPIFKLNSDTNGLLSIVDSKLIINTDQDSNFIGSQDISISVTDKGGLSFTKDFIVNILPSLNGTSSDNIIFGTAGAEQIRGLNGVDHIYGNGGDDLLYGGKGGDTISGGSGNDFIMANEGDDHIYGGAGSDSIDGGDGNDLASYWGSSEGITINLRMLQAFGGDAEGDLLFNIENIGATHHNDELTGDSNDNIFFAGSGGDVINGAAGNDKIYASGGDDILIGGLGVDILVGGAGKDIFVFETIDDSTATETDLIRDFTQGDDQLDVSALGFTSLADFIVSNVGSNTIVSVNDNDFELELQGTVALSAGDFIWS